MPGTGNLTNCPGLVKSWISEQDLQWPLDEISIVFNGRLTYSSLHPQENAAPILRGRLLKLPKCCALLESHTWKVSWH